MWTVKPRSLLACSAIAGMAVTGGPAWFSTTSLMFCAQMVGKPLTAPDPTANPAAALAPRNTLRRVALPILVSIFGTTVLVAPQHGHDSSRNARSAFCTLIL
jgi:hypothetical protein